MIDHFPVRVFEYDDLKDRDRGFAGAVIGVSVLVPFDVFLYRVMLAHYPFQLPVHFFCFSGGGGIRTPIFRLRSPAFRVPCVALTPRPYVIKTSYIVQYFIRILLIIVAEEVFLYLYYIKFFLTFQVVRVLRIELK